MANAFLRVLLVVLGVGSLTLFPATTDVFCDNLKHVAATLPRNTASSPQHFATAVFGQAPDVVYALALCGGDVANYSDCGECVSSAFDVLLNSTPCDKAGHRYGGYCDLFYSADEILTSSKSPTRRVQMETTSLMR